MEVNVQTLAETRQVAISGRNLCRHAGRRLGHDTDSCACPICTSARLLAQVVQQLGSLERPTQEQDWYV